jgi:Leucine-rich repeat (LRR) protein
VLSHNQMVEVPSPLRLPLLRKLWLGGNSIVSLWPWAVAMHNHTSNKGVGCDEGGGRTQKEEGRAEEATWLPSLEQLHLHDNKISRIEAGAFVGMPLLRFLDLAFNRLITTNLSDIQRLWGREITISTAAMTAMPLFH